MRIDEEALTFDDVLLEPAASSTEPDQADVRSRFSRSIPLNIPLVSAAMDTVTESSVAIALAREGGIGVLHRNMTAEHEVEEVRAVKHAEDLIQRNVITVGTDATVADVERLMNEHQISGIPVMKGKRICSSFMRWGIRSPLRSWTIPATSPSSGWFAPWAPKTFCMRASRRESSVRRKAWCVASMWASS